MDNTAVNSSGNNGIPPRKYGLAIVLVILVVFSVSLYLVYHSDRSGSEKLTIGNDTERILVDGQIIPKNESLASIAGQIVQSRLDKIKLLAESYAARPEFRDAVARKQWDSAINIARLIIHQNESVERIMISDIGGDLKADFPHLENVIDKNFSFRDWYRGVIRNSGTYLSRVYIRTAKPQYKVVTMAIPVNQGNEIEAIFLVQIKLDTFKGWINEINSDLSAKVFILDQNGQVVAHPDIDSQDEIVDYSLEPDVQKFFQSGDGNEIILSKKRYLSSFSGLDDYGWAVFSRLGLSKLGNVESGRESSGLSNSMDELLKNPFLIVAIINSLALVIVAFILKRRDNYLPPW